MSNPGPGIFSFPEKVAWEKRGGLIYTSLPSEGWSGQQCLTQMVNHGIWVSGHAQEALFSPFKVMSPGDTHELVGIPLSSLESSLWRTDSSGEEVIELEHIRREGLVIQGLYQAHLEATILFRLRFSDGDINQMGGEWAASYHELLNEFLLAADTRGEGKSLVAHKGLSETPWGRKGVIFFSRKQLVSAYKK